MALSATAASIRRALVMAGASKWTSLQITGLAGDLVGISVLTFHVWGVTVGVNQSPVANAGINWTHVAGSGITLADPTTVFSISGNAQLSLAGFVAVQGHFDIAKTTLTDTGGAFTNADALLVSLSNLSVFAGVGGTFDAHGTATDYSDDTLDVSNAIGLSATASSIKLALVAAGTSKWTGLQITGLAGDLVGISVLTFHVWGVTVGVNQSPVANAGINWTHVAGSGITLADPTTVFSISGNAQLSLAGFVAVQGHFDIAKTTLTDTGGAFTNADALLVSLSNLSVFAGVGGTFDAQGTATDYSDDTLDVSNAIGLSATATSIKLALVTAGTSKWTGLQITGLAGNLVGIDVLTFHVWGVTVGVNQSPVANAGINWTNVAGSGLTLSDPTTVFSISGNAQISLAGFVAVQGHFDIAKKTLTDTGGAFTNADALLVSLSNLSVFAGVGATYDDHGTATDYSDDTLDLTDAIGLSAMAASIKLALVTSGVSKWTGLRITGLAGDLVGISVLTFHVW